MILSQNEKLFNIDNAYQLIFSKYFKKKYRRNQEKLYLGF